LLDRPELGAGEEGWAQLRLAGPVAAARGDRVVVRRPSPSATLAGGVIVDAQPLRHRRFSPRVLRHLEVLAAGAPEDRVLDALSAGSFQSTSEIAARADLAPDDARRTLEALAAAGRVHRAGALWCGASYWNDLVARAREALAAHHTRYPLRRGLPAEELRVRLRLSPEAWSAASHALEEEGAVRLLGEVVALVEHEPRFTPAQERAADLVRQTLAAHPYAPPALADLPGVDAELLEALVERGEVVAIADGVHLGRAAYEEMVAAALEAIDAQGSVTVAALRDRFGTSRKYALALLEHLDDERITRRVGDARVRGSRALRNRP
jgi:selenocysteine-specific elongation factor